MRSSSEKPRRHLGVESPLIDVGEYLQRFWRKFRPDPVHVPDEVNRHAVRAPVVDLEEPEGATKWGFVSGCMAGLRHRHDSLPKSKESQIRALEKGRHQHSSSLPTLVLTLALEGPDPANGGKC